MIRNYFKIAWRNLKRNKVSSLINIGGLAIGMAVTMLIGLWIVDELSYDHFSSHHDRIAKIRQHITVNGTVQTEKTVPCPLPAELKNHYGRYFKYVVMSSHRGAHVLSAAEKNVSKYGVYLGADAINMFGLTMLHGDTAALRDPHSIILSAAAAKLFFGDNDPINQPLKIDNALDVKVTGVFSDIPANSTFSGLQFIAPYELYAANSWIRSQENVWNSSPIQAYVEITENETIDHVSSIIKDVKLKNLSAEDAKFKPAIFLDAMDKWHLYADFRNGIRTGGKIDDLWMFGIIGLFVLLLACINFMNLSTARSEKRAKETGIRKTMGSARIQLITQFFSESLLVTFFACICAICLVQLSLPFFNQLADKKMQVPWRIPLFWITGFVFCVITGLIAGSYPAVYLSSFKPVKVLKGSFRAGRLASLPRKVLVVLQFTVSVALIICTAVVLRQIKFTKNRPVGYDREMLLELPVMNSGIMEHFSVVRDDLIKTGAVTAVAASEGTITDIWGTETNLDWKGKDPNVKVDFPNTAVSAAFGNTVGWQFVEGRDFSREILSDSSAFVINEAAARYMGFKNPVGETIRFNNRPFTVIGVIKNVITESPYEEVRPALYCMAGNAGNFLYVRMKSNIPVAAAVEKIGTVFKRYSPSSPFDYKFVDEEFGKKFGNEERIGRLASFFSILAILISCLGLFGLASYVAEQRTKEIGLRKVLGASVFNIWQLLSKEFIGLVSIALLIATLLAWYFMRNWLQHYPYRTSLSWWIFAMAGAGAMIITLLTVSFQAIKAAIANPVKSLRTE